MSAHETLSYCIIYKIMGYNLDWQADDISLESVARRLQTAEGIVNRLFDAPKRGNAMMLSVSTIFFALRPIVVGLEREELSEIIIQPMQRMLLPLFRQLSAGHPRHTSLCGSLALPGVFP